MVQNNSNLYSSDEFLDKVTSPDYVFSDSNEKQDSDSEAGLADNEESNAVVEALMKADPKASSLPSGSQSDSSTKDEMKQLEEVVASLPGENQPGETVQDLFVKSARLAQRTKGRKKGFIFKDKIKRQRNPKHKENLKKVKKALYNFPKDETARAIFFEKNQDILALFEQFFLNEVVFPPSEEETLHLNSLSPAGTTWKERR